MNRIILLLILLFSFTLNAQFLLYSGDANNDGVANYIDVLPIGLAYLQEGPAREIPSTNWIQQEFFPFGQTLPSSGVDYAFIDCNGNGLIDSLDIEAVFLNYDSIQGDANPMPMPYLPSDTLFTSAIPEVSISFAVDTAFVDDTIFVEVAILFPDSLAQEAALGIALGLMYDPEFVKDSLTVIFPDTLSDDLMFVTAASNFSSLWRLPPRGRIEIGAAGRGQNAIDGSRIIATVRIVIEDQIIRSEGEHPFFFDLSDVLLLNAQEQVLEIGFRSDTLLLLDTVTSIQVLHTSDEIKIYPNPARNQLTIESGIGTVQELQLLNQLGQVVKTRTVANRRKFRFYTNDVPFGLYYLHLKTSEGSFLKKLIISP